MTAKNIRGPKQIADAARIIIEGMRGKPLDEEIEDVMTDAIWDAFVAGRESVAAPSRKPPPRRPSHGARPAPSTTPEGDHE